MCCACVTLCGWGKENLRWKEARLIPPPARWWRSGGLMGWEGRRSQPGEPARSSLLDDLMMQLVAGQKFAAKRRSAPLRSAERSRDSLLVSHRGQQSHVDTALRSHVAGRHAGMQARRRCDPTLSRGSPSARSSERLVARQHLKWHFFVSCIQAADNGGHMKRVPNNGTRT